MCHVFIRYHSIPSSSCSFPFIFNRSAFIVYLIPCAFDSRHSPHSSLILECSRFFASSLEFLLHLIPFPFRLGPKISGRDLLLVEECCNTADSMRQVSSSYSPLFPCHLLACCILPCHHVHCIAYVFVSCIRAFSPLSILRSDTPMPSGVPLLSPVVSGC